MKRLSEDKGGWNTDENGDRMDEEWFLKGERERERIRVSGKCTRAPVSSVPGVK